MRHNTRTLWPDVRVIPEVALIDGLREQRGAKIVTIAAITEPRLLAKHPESGEPNDLRGSVFKISRVNGIIGWQYESSVNRQLAREGKPADFQAAERTWGQRITGTPLVEHNGQFYLEVKVERSIDHRYFNNGGEPLESVDVEQFLPRRGGAGRQGVERPIILRDYALASIIWLKLDGVTYVVRRGTVDPARSYTTELAEARRAA